MKSPFALDIRYGTHTGRIVGSGKRPAVNDDPTGSRHWGTKVRWTEGPKPSEIGTIVSPPIGTDLSSVPVGGVYVKWPSLKGPPMAMLLEYLEVLT